MTTFLISDLHWGHRNLVSGESRWADTSRCRQFSDVWGHNEWLIGCWNQVVKPHDQVIVLGDWAICSFEAARKTTARLNGYKVLVRGNHDKSPERMLAVGFDEVFEGPCWYSGGYGRTIKFEQTRPEDENDLLLCHFPWAKQAHDGRYVESMPVESDYSALRPILVHGHTHSRERVSSPTSIHIGADAWDYTPVPLDEVLALAAKLKSGR